MSQEQQEYAPAWWTPDRGTIFSFVFPQAHPFMVAVADAKTVADVRRKFDASGVIEGREPFTGSPVEIWERPNWIARPVDPMSEGIQRQDPDK